ncbi:MAG: histidine kinase [Acidobacteriota bacterium]|nr:histidine kinase [Acidobacteriota bacterium]
MRIFARHRWLIILGLVGWTLFGVFFALQNYVNAIYYGQKISLGHTLAVWLICGYAWMFLTPLVVNLAEKFFIESGRIGRNLAIHFFAGSLISLIQLSIFIFVRQWFLGNPQKPFSFSTDFQRLFIGEFHINLLIYWIVVGISHLRLLNRRYLERERERARLALSTSQLETKLAQAQLDALKMQLHPHFLFNTLNSISVLMRDDVKAANRMLVRLSELLRVALKSEGTQEISLKDELEFLRGYLEIEQIRFQDRLQVDFEVETETLDARVPNLILQPLVENAIKHGIAPLATTGKITIEAKRENGFVRLSVSDNGAGLSKTANGENGIGLKNTRERLKKLYGEKQQFEIASKRDGGLQVEIKIPFHNGENGN